MIYPNRPWIFSKYKKSTLSSQEGVTLLLSIIILSAILAISFSIAAILLGEIKVSGDGLRTEAAIVGADAVTEEALFKIKRKVSTCSSCTFSYTNLLGAVNLSSTESQETPQVYQVKVAASSNSFAASSNRYPLFNLLCPSPITDPLDPLSADPICSVAGSGFGKIKFTYLPSGNNDKMAVYVCEFDPNLSYLTPACSDVSSTEYWSPDGNDGKYYVNSPLDPGLYGEFTLDPTKQQEIIVYNYNGTNPLYVQLEAFTDTAGLSPKGIPLVGETAVNVSARNSQVTRKIRVVIPEEGETSARINYALQANGGRASASNTCCIFSPAATINGDRTGINWDTGNGWNSSFVLPDWLQIDFTDNTAAANPVLRNINEIDVITLQDAYASNPVDPDLAMTFSSYGIVDFQVQYWDGSAWQLVTGGNIIGNNKIWKQITFPFVTTSKIRINVTSGVGGTARIVEVEAY